MHEYCRSLNEGSDYFKPLLVWVVLGRKIEFVILCRTELAQLMSKSVPIPFPNRHFQQLPGGTISLQETSERQMAQAMPQAAETGQGCTSLPVWQSTTPAVLLCAQQRLYTVLVEVNDTWHSIDAQIKTYSLGWVALDTSVT